MGRVTRFTSEQIRIIAEMVVEVGPSAAVKELAKVGIKVTAGGAYYWSKRIFPDKVKPKPKRNRMLIEVV